MFRQKFTSKPQLKFILCILERGDVSSARFSWHVLKEESCASHTHKHVRLCVSKNLPTFIVGDVQM